MVSAENLFNSIHAVVCADVIIKGFSSFTAQLQKFRKPNHSAVTIQVRKDDDFTLNLVEQLVQSKTI